MSVTLSLFAGAGAQFLDNNGNMLSGGLIYTYNAGTTTPLATYTSNLGTVAHPNPIILDSAGRIPDGGETWVANGVSYKFVLKDSNDVLIATYDNIVGIADSASLLAYEAAVAASTGSSLVGFIQSGTSAVATTVQAKLQESISVMDFIPAAQQAAIINGTSSLATYDCYSAFVAAITAALQTWGSSFYATNPKVYVPLGKYYLSSTIVLTNQVQLYGDTSGYG